MSKTGIMIPKATGWETVSYTKVQYIQSDLKYCTVVTVNGSYTFLASLRSFERSLPKSLFIRIHKSFIVSIRYIHFIDKAHITVAGHSIPIGRRRITALRSRFLKYG